MTEIPLAKSTSVSLIANVLNYDILKLNHFLIFVRQGDSFKMSEHAASDKSDDSSDSDAAPPQQQKQQQQPPSPPTVDESPLQKCMDRNKRCKLRNVQTN